MGASFKIVDALASARALRRWTSDVEAALDTISWHAGLIAAKVHRALHGLAECVSFTSEDPVQDDWNGSAKLARILVAESKSAWQVVMREGEAAADSPLLELVVLLDRIDKALGERFPDAMKFLRPGFARCSADRTGNDLARGSRMAETLAVFTTPIAGG